MKKSLFFVIVLIISSHAQNCGDTISLKGNWFIGYKYSYQCSEYNKVTGFFTIKSEFKDVVSINQTAKIELNAAETYSVIGNVIGCIGGGITGWYLADLTYGKKVDSWVWPTAISLIGVGFTLDIFGIKHLLKSVKIFNNIKS
jgi:hypothetical protein